MADDNHILGGAFSENSLRFSIPFKTLCGEYLKKSFTQAFHTLKDSTQHARMVFMYGKFRLALYTTLLVASSVAPAMVSAQGYVGDFSPHSAQQDAGPDYSAPIPRIFSSGVSNVTLVEKLDETYDNLLMSLWNYAQSDFVHQKALSRLMNSKRFRTTRYAKEFTPAMNEALRTLNDNYKSMTAEIAVAEARYETIMKALAHGDQMALESSWTEKISEFKRDADLYFKMQHEFLNTYRNLVAFVLKQGGRYYYKAETNKVYFYKFGSYKFFGKSIDKMRMITYRQKQFLKAHAPANVDLLALQ